MQRDVNEDFVTVIRRARPYGIRFCGLSYRSAALDEFLENSQLRAPVVEFRVSWADVRVAQFRDPRNGAWRAIEVCEFSLFGLEGMSLVEVDQQREATRLAALAMDAEAAAAIDAIWPQIMADFEASAARDVRA